MKYAASLWSGLALCVVLVVILLLKIQGLDTRIRNLGESSRGELAALQDSLKRVPGELAGIKASMPGLGEYMTTIQLHAAKLWFAAKASNWELAEYEIDELKETMEAAKGLNAEKNGVNISNVLDSVIQTEVTHLAESIKRKSETEFLKSYDETLSACNGCHTESGHKFIRIVRPTAPPVTNQRWDSVQSSNIK